MQNLYTQTTGLDGRLIKIHGPAAFEGMRKAGKLAAECLDFITPHVQPKISTNQLNKLCHDFVAARGGISAPLNYRGFPKSICTSINHVVCHGIPSEKILRDGDIINIDVTTIVDSWHGDSSRMYTVGKINRKAERLIEATFEAMWCGIHKVRPGATLGDIGHAIQTYAEGERFSVVRDFCGHGLGQVFHEAPNVMHFGHQGEGEILKEGMFFTVEPMINTGSFEVKILSDGWTAVTKDRSLSAQFEHSLAVTDKGYEIFTLSPTGLNKPPYNTQ